MPPGAQNIGVAKAHSSDTRFTGLLAAITVETETPHVLEEPGKEAAAEITVEREEIRSGIMQYPEGLSTAPTVTPSRPVLAAAGFGTLEVDAGAGHSASATAAMSPRGESARPASVAMVNAMQENPRRAVQWTAVEL